MGHPAASTYSPLSRSLALSRSLSRSLSHFLTRLCMHALHASANAPLPLVLVSLIYSRAAKHVVRTTLCMWRPVAPPLPFRHHSLEAIRACCSFPGGEMTGHSSCRDPVPRRRRKHTKTMGRGHRPQGRRLWGTFTFPRPSVLALRVPSRPHTLFLCPAKPFAHGLCALA